MEIRELKFVKDFCKMAHNGWLQGWHERNGGNLSYRVRPEEVEEIKPLLGKPGKWTEIGATVPTLGGEYFLVTGSGKFMQNVLDDPDNNIAFIEIDKKGLKYRICWGLCNGGRPTSELPSHLMNHAVKKEVTGGRHRVIYHSHPANIIAMTFVLPLEDAVFTREIWEMMTECPVVFPEGIGVVPWMVPGGEEIAIETSKLMRKYNVAVWAHHGIFCSEENFDLCFGLMHTVEKAAEIYVKQRSMSNKKLQSITPEDFRELAIAFGVTLPEEFIK